MRWNKLDMFPSGKAGIEARWREDDGDIYCFIGGSDHWVDWLHHFLPGSREREIVCGLYLASFFKRKIKNAMYIGGHSVGGVVASLAGQVLRDEGYDVYTWVFGGKRPLKGTEECAVSFRRRGDIVPFLPPWRPGYKYQNVVGEWMPFWKAHGPGTYYELMGDTGFR